MKTTKFFSNSVIAMLIISSSCTYTGNTNAQIVRSQISIVDTIYRQVDAHEIIAAAGGTTAHTLVVCVYPAISEQSGNTELQVFFPGLSGDKPTDANEIPSLYYMEVAYPLAGNISAINFLFFPQSARMEYYILERNETEARNNDHDSSTCKCPPECCYETVLSRGYAAECHTESPDCPPSTLTAMRLASIAKKNTAAKSKVIRKHPETKPNQSSKGKVSVNIKTDIKKKAVKQ
jgi:hypothetical protein